MVLSAATNVFRHTPDRKNRCMMLIDELAALGRLPDLPDDLATLAGYGLDFTLIVQNLAQLKEHYGVLADSILNSCSWQWFSNVGELTTAKYVSESLGKRTIVTQSTSLAGENQSMSYGEMGRDLMTPAEVQAMGKTVAIVFQQGSLPRYLRTVDYWHMVREFGWLREKLMRRYFKDPYLWSPNPYLKMDEQARPEGL